MTDYCSGIATDLDEMGAARPEMADALDAIADVHAVLFEHPLDTTALLGLIAKLVLRILGGDLSWPELDRELIAKAREKTGDKEQIHQKERSVMSNEISTSTQESPPPVKSKPRLSRAEQDQTIANNITDASHIIEIGQSDPELRPVLEAKGYDVAELSKGAVLQTAAQAAFNERQKAVGRQREATALASAAEEAARRTYSDFRNTARAVFTQEADRVNLGLSGKVPADLEKFITAARASYNAAKDEPSASKLAKRGFKAADTANAEAGLQTLSAAESEQVRAIAAAQQATRNRDAAYTALMEWMSEFRRIARVAFRGNSALGGELRL